MPDPQLSIVRFEPLTVAQSAPLGSERTRIDTNAIGIDHDKVMHAVADAASKLPEPIRKYVAQQGGFFADVAASIMEMLSAPETIASAGAGTLPNAVDAGANGMAKVGAPIKAGVTLAKDLATDPDVVGMAFPRTANAMRKAQTVRDAIAKRTTPVEAPPSVATAPPAASAVGGTPPQPDLPPPVAPVESPASPTPPPVDSTTSPTFYPQKALNELAVAARRAKVKLSDQDYVMAVEAVKHGATPEEAVAAVKQTSPPKLKVSADESKLYVQLRRMGKTDAEVWEAIQQARILRDHFGLKTPTVAETKFPKGFGDRGSTNGMKPLP
jgi:hypothetical protein